MTAFAAPRSSRTGHRRPGVIALCLALLAGIPATWAATPPAERAGATSRATKTLADTACRAIAARVDAIPGNAPLLLRSYDSLDGHGAPGLPPLHAAAFPYDNALAVIALLACGKPAQAERIAEALRLAATNDSRLRDAYRAGAVGNGKPLPNGWWDARQKRWIDAARDYSGAYQDGSSCGNLAWAALAFLAMHDATGDVRWRDAAARLADWVVEHAADARGAGGFSGGIESYLLVPQKAPWKSTEHNIDLVALFDWLQRSAAPGDWAAQARRARRFVDAQWDAASGHFWMGTTADGATPLHAPSALDVQLWALLLPDAPGEWRRALTWVERTHATRGGFDFTGTHDGLWTEGTAQAALVYRRQGRDAEADRLLSILARQVSPGGLLWATPQERVTAPYSYYHHQPHLGATAWAVLAVLDRNPYLPAGSTVARQAADSR